MIPKTTQLSVMLVLQDKANAIIEPNWLDKDFAYTLAAMLETVEAIDHFGWKWWKHTTPNLPQTQMELVDIWHFILSELLRSRSGCIKSTCDLIEEDLGGTAHSLLINNKWSSYKEASTLDLLRLLATQFGASKIHLKLFREVMLRLDMDFNFLFKWYVGKNALNNFRQAYGYKTGEYVKVWCGREDNEYLTELLEKASVPDTELYDTVYFFLEKTYADLVLHKK